MYGARIGKKIKPDSVVYMGAVLEYLMAEVLELAGNCARDMKKKTIKPRHVMMAVAMDDELKPLFDGVKVNSRIICSFNSEQWYHWLLGYHARWWGSPRHSLVPSQEGGPGDLQGVVQAEPLGEDEERGKGVECSDSSRIVLSFLYPLKNSVH